MSSSGANQKGNMEDSLRTPDFVSDELQELFELGARCVQDPSPVALELFRAKCKPLPIMSLIRAMSENNDPARKKPFRLA